MADKLQLLKIGGKVLDDEALLAQVLTTFLHLEGRKLLVHGGGKRTSELSERLGLTPHMVDGRRITDAETLEVATMVYAGLFNKMIVSKLQSFGVNALGLSGADGNVIQAHKRPVKTIDYGFVGDIDQVDSAAINRLIQADFTPVFCAITHDGKGQLLNTNADTIAAQLAMALAPLYHVTLIYCLEKDGVLSDPNDDHSVIPELTPATYAAHRESGVISAGMIPKLDNAFNALQVEVAEVVICGPQSFTRGGGTHLHR